MHHLLFNEPLQSVAQPTCEISILIHSFSNLQNIWLLSDTCPGSVGNERLLILYDVENDWRYDIGSFYTDLNLGKPNRCDLYPRWNPEPRQICIDSVHEQVRQM
ncbi:MAG: hypothetical protein GY896_14235 [Gammaproteobacteria bacterium]|nr:hypothetical protein [Gammaproteobacteria bacterium]